MRDTDPFREMYLKIYKQSNIHSLEQFCALTHAFRSVTGQVICPVANSRRTVRRPEWGKPSRRALQPENTMQVTIKRAGAPLQRPWNCPRHSLWRRFSQPSLEKPGVKCLGQCLSRRLGVEETFPLGRFLPPKPFYFALSCCWKFS